MAASVPWEFQTTSLCPEFGYCSIFIVSSDRSSYSDDGLIYIRAATISDLQSKVTLNRLNGINAITRCWGYLGNIFGISFGYLWDNFGISLGHPWDIFGISLGYLLDIFRISWGYLGDHWSICLLVHWSIGPLVNYD